MPVFIEIVLKFWSAFAKASADNLRSAQLQLAPPTEAPQERRLEVVTGFEPMYMDLQSSA